LSALSASTPAQRAIAVAISSFVQVFGCLHDDPIHARRRQASEKRQGTKSREVARLRCGGLYGDLITAGAMAVEIERARAGRTCFLGAIGDSRPSGRGVGGQLDVCREPGMGRNNTSGNVPGRRAVCETGGFAASNPSRRHDVSILIGVGAGVGRYVGSQPRAKTSMTIMRAPQRG